MLHAFYPRFKQYINTAHDLHFDDVECIHTSDEAFVQRKGRCEKVDGGFKPWCNATWASISDDPIHEVSQWDTWTRTERFKIGNNITTFNISSNATIMYCTKLSDLIYMHSIIPYDDFMSDYGIDWKYIASICDVFILDTRKTSFADKGYRSTIDMWDIPTSIVVFNHDVIYNVKTAEITAYTKNRHMDYLFKDML